MPNVYFIPIGNFKHMTEFPSDIIIYIISTVLTIEDSLIPQFQVLPPYLIADIYRMPFDRYTLILEIIGSELPFLFRPESPIKDDIYSSGYEFNRFLKQICFRFHNHLIVLFSGILTK